MNNFKGCIPCVCTTGSGRKQSCEEQNIGTQSGATTTNTATETVEQSDIINFLKNQQKQQNQPNIQPNLKNQLKQLNSQKLKRQLEVVPSPAEVCQSDPDGYPAAFVPSRVPRWRRPPYLNIPMLWDDVQQISPHMTKVNVMAKFNTVPDSALSEIEDYLDI